MGYQIGDFGADEAGATFLLVASHVLPLMGADCDTADE